MFIDTVKNRRWSPTILIRESKWIDGKTQKITLANLTKLPQPVIDGIRILLKGGIAVDSVEDAFTIVSNTPHGHVAAVLGIMEKLNIPSLIAPNNSRFRRLVLGMIAVRVLEQSNLATSTILDVASNASTLNDELALNRVDQDDLYRAMGKLVKRKTAIERRLAKRHLTESGMVLCDVAGSYMDDKKSEITSSEYDRDRKTGTEQIAIGLMTAPDGCPVSVDVFSDNTGDGKFLSTQVDKIQKTFELKHMVLVGGREILKQKHIQEEVMPAGLDWITSMKKSQIRKIVEQENIQMSLFDDQDLVEVRSHLYSEERLLLYRNPLQADKGKRQREEFLARTEEALDEIVQATRRKAQRLEDQGAIGVRVGSVVGKHKMWKFFTLDIRHGHFSYIRNTEAIAQAERLDGMYAIRSSMKEGPEPEELVANYKRLSMVEFASRTMNRLSHHACPTYHRKKDRMIAHVFLCMLAYYVEYHLRRELAPMLYAEDDPAKKKVQRENIVEWAGSLPKAKGEVQTRQREQDEKVMDFLSLMDELAGLCRLVVRPKTGANAEKEVIMLETVSKTQQKAFEILGVDARKPFMSKK